MNRLRVSMTALTPLFIGGADPNERAELRMSSFKGVMRYWYRAIDGLYQERERQYFGSTDTGQSACIMRSSGWQTGITPWNPSGQSGTSYLGFSLNMEDENRRKAIPQGRSFNLEVLPRPSYDEPETRRAWIAALWMLVHVGGIGARSRRGFGSLRIDSWTGWPECGELDLACNAGSPEEYDQQISNAFQRIRNWFPNMPGEDHTILGTDLKPYIQNTGHETWHKALGEAGEQLREFRRKAGTKRVGFGLPIDFKRASLEVYSDMRMASPLFMRVLRLGQNYHTAFFGLTSPPPPADEFPGGRAQWPDGAADVVREFLTELRNERF